MNQLSVQAIERAKAGVIRQIGDEPWLRSVGIGLVADGPGIVVGVAPAGEQAAKAALARLRTRVPTRVVVLGPIRKRDRA